MSVDWNNCDACWETYPDCNWMTTECENYTFCSRCVDYNDFNEAWKLDEDWLIKKEFFNIKEKIVTKTEIEITFN